MFINYPSPVLWSTPHPESQNKEIDMLIEEEFSDLLCYEMDDTEAMRWFEEEEESDG